MSKKMRHHIGIREMFAMVILFGTLFFASCKTIESESLYTKNPLTKLPEGKGEETEKWTVWIAVRMVINSKLEQL